MIEAIVLSRLWHTEQAPHQIAASGCEAVLLLPCVVAMRVWPAVSEGFSEAWHAVGL